MAITDLKDSNSTRPRFTDLGKRSQPYSFYVFAILFFFCTVSCTTTCRAQDLAEAARQERARKKDDQQKPANHVYTEEDLRRARILTPEDSARLEAKKRGQVPPGAEKPVEAIEAQSAPQQLPLGEIARQFRKQKQARQPQQSAEFHLPFSNPSFATPIRPQPLLRPHSNRKDPFLRPPILHPSISGNTSLAPSPAPIAPSLPVAPISRPITPALHAVTVERGDSLWKLAQQNLGKGSRWPEFLAVNPQIANPGQIQAGAQIFLPARYSARVGVSKISVRKGDTLWRLAQTHFGRAGSWPCIARANPAIQDANRIYEGQELILPANCGP